MKIGSGCWVTVESYVSRPGRADVLSSPGNLSKDGGHHGSASPARHESADDRRDAGRAILAGGSKAGGSTDEPHSSLPTAPARTYRRGSSPGRSAARASNQSTRTRAAVAGAVLPRGSGGGRTDHPSSPPGAISPGGQHQSDQSPPRGPGRQPHSSGRGGKISGTSRRLRQLGRRVLGVCCCLLLPTRRA